VVIFLDGWMDPPSLSLYARPYPAIVVRFACDDGGAWFVGLQGANSPYAHSLLVWFGPPRLACARPASQGPRACGATRVNSDAQLICPGPVWGCIALHCIAWAHGWITVLVNRARVGNSLPCRRRFVGAARTRRTCGASSGSWLLPSPDRMPDGWSYVSGDE